MKVLLLSQNKENINIISKIFKGSEFMLEVLQIFDRLDSSLENIKLIILDICNMDIEKASYYADFLKKSVIWRRQGFYYNLLAKKPPYLFRG
ncbi:MAG: hypothetical protein KKE35_02650 [Actinobacteria bacterium]|nr:hypothetical protein [Actinomycetota bacterium]